MRNSTNWAERKQWMISARDGQGSWSRAIWPRRGLDIPGITHIVQLDVNENEDFFIHRAGRTARAGKSGINVIFGDEKEMRSLSRIEKKLGIVIYPKVLFGGVIRSPEPENDEH